ncbi:FAD-binding oxidoreductase [Gloeobacter morelensis]|uniref:FAD-binding oxidoreductase n=1 Tax=Gloeobacter morelensis MG652769 TaxID=2781736 RepID=A0ABY3PNI7_9CYAN|nr:FAD-binding oxidoreductase [Gloeobacter morelensis]UFP95232.1 FAD-binding oxidoreductase [Gloeobacter morelensis MG652769]
MSTTSRPIFQTLEAIVGNTGWYALDRCSPAKPWIFKQIGLDPETPVVLPDSPTLLAEVMICAHRERWRVLPVGHSSKLGWGTLPRGADLLVGTARLDRLVEHAAGDLTVTAEAGIGFAVLQEKLAQANQFLALDPAYSEGASLGGILSTADSGPLRHRYGGVRDMCLGISVVRADGKMVKAGGRVVKNVAGYDLMKLFTGAFGTLGIVSELTFRLHPLPEAWRTVVLGAPTAEDLSRAAASLLASALAPLAVEIVDESTLAGLGLGDKSGLLVRFGGIEASVREQSTRLLALAPGLSPQVLEGQEEGKLWEQLRSYFWRTATPEAVVCKLGMPPARAVAVLGCARERGAQVCVRGGNGVGIVRWEAPNAAAVVAVRDFCRAEGGYLTILEAPAALKDTLDVWDIAPGTAALMGRLRRQFDPEQIFACRPFGPG